MLAEFNHLRGRGAGTHSLDFPLQHSISTRWSADDQAGAGAAGATATRHRVGGRSSTSVSFSLGGFRCTGGAPVDARILAVKNFSNIGRELGVCEPRYLAPAQFFLDPTIPGALQLTGRVDLGPHLHHHSVDLQSERVVVEVRLWLHTVLANGREAGMSQGVLWYALDVVDAIDVIGDGGAGASAGMRGETEQRGGTGSLSGKSSALPGVKGGPRRAVGGSDDLSTKGLGGRTRAENPKMLTGYSGKIFGVKTPQLKAKRCCWW